MPDPAASPSSSAASLARRAAVAVFLLLGFYALAIGIAAGLLYLVYVMVSVGSRIPLKLIAVAVIAAAVILWSILPRADRFEIPGPCLRADVHPRLFTALREVAGATRQTMPLEVYLVHDMNAWVSSRGGVMGLGSRRIMGLGLPLLQLLSVAELKAVLAHEFGHYHGGDVKLGPWIYKTRAAIGRTIVALHQAESAVMHLPFEWYGSMFLRVTHGISRHQEFQADALAAQVIGPGPLIAGLKRVHGGALAYHAYLEGELLPVLHAGFRPPVADGFRRFVNVKDLAEQIDQAVAKELDGGETDPFDTHPALAERVAAVQDLPPQPLAPDDDQPAITLLEDLPEVERDLLEHMLVDSRMVAEAQAIEWSEVGGRVYARISREVTEQHGTRFQGLTVGTVPADPEVLAWHARNLVPDAAGTTLELAELGARLLTHVILHRLVESGWTLEALPGTPVVACHDEHRLAPGPLLNQLVHGTIDLEAWRVECERVGVVDLAL